MQSPRRWPIRDILALSVVALCALAILAALLHPGAGVEPLLLLLGGAVVVVAQWYFERVKE
jgi:hypothetical protein